MQISEHLHRFEDSCNVYVLVDGTDAVLIDVGTGDVLEQLAQFGVRRVTDVLMTHHHRDQAQGLPRAAQTGARIWVPPVEVDLFAHVDEHWQQRSLDNYYNPRQDRFSLIAPVPVHATSPEYRTVRVGAFAVRTIPTPGHTTGSVSYLVEVDGRTVAFTGDLLCGPGQVWSLAATQWSYTGHEGLASTVLSLHEVLDEGPATVLPSHGEPIDDFPAAVAATEPNLRALLDLGRNVPWDLDAWRNEPFEILGPHLLRNRTANAQSYALLSESGGALLIDFGYDMGTGWPAGHDRAARPVWLPSLRALKRDFGVDRVEVAIPTHYHDDHVAGFNLLRDVEGTEIWCEQGIAAILADPARYDLPCLYADPIATDRILPTGQPVAWHEYEITLYPLPGHCGNQVAIGAEVDGRRILATGDQQESRWAPDRSEVLNYQYKNGFRPEDYVAAAQLYRRVSPDLILTGHWGVRQVDDAYLAEMLRQSQRLVQLHVALSARDDVDFGPGDFAATMQPYRAWSHPGEMLRYQVAVRNPQRRRAPCAVSLAVPSGWSAAPTVREIDLDPGETGTVDFVVTSPPDAGQLRRAVLAADLTVDGRRVGQHAECLVDLR